jgi:hydroxyacylglutathione hydrolase
MLCWQVLQGASVVVFPTTSLHLNRPYPGIFSFMTISAKQGIVLSLIMLTAIFSHAAYSKEMPVNLNQQPWIHGSQDCAKNIDEAIQVVQFDKNSWILRQNKCLNYEAPFMFLFIGQNKALFIDTGATKDESLFPLYKTVYEIISNWQDKQQRKLDLVVAHTHKHGDHYAADNQFKGKANTTVVGLEVDDVKTFFQIKNWPEEIASFDLGNRELKIIPIPGHQAASIAIYDTSSKLLLTGDTFYPGRLYVDDWSAFRKSIQKLSTFVEHNEVSYILGNHIEMSTSAGVDYPINTTYQPQEHKLPLIKKDLQTLNRGLQALGEKATRKVFSNFIIYPND